MLIEFCGTSAMGKTTMTRILVENNSCYRPFRKSVSGIGYRHTFLQLKLFSMGFLFEMSRLFKEKDFSRFLKISMLRGAVNDANRWVLDQGFLQPTALLTDSEEYKSEVYLSKLKSLNFFPDLVVFFLAAPEFSEERQSKRGDIDTIKYRSKSLGFSSLREHYRRENLMWLDLIPILEKNGVSTIVINVDSQGNLKDLISFVGRGEGHDAIVRELSSFLEKQWDPDE